MRYKASRLVLSLLFFALIGCESVKQNLLADDRDQLQTLINDDDQLQANSVQEAVDKARIAWQQRKTDLAQVLYVKAYDLNPGNSELLKEMATIYSELDKPELVLYCYKLILSEHPEDIAVQEKYGLLLMQRRKFDDAESALQKVVSNDNKNWKAHNALGIIADLKGKHEQAVKHFSVALTIYPNQPEILNNLGYSLYMSGQLDKAQNLFTQALKINPDYKKAIYNSAMIEARKKNYQMAVDLFSKVVNPAEAHNNVGYIAMMNGDFTESEYFLNQAIKLSPHYYAKANSNLQELNARKQRSEQN